MDQIRSAETKTPLSGRENPYNDAASSWPIGSTEYKVELAGIRVGETENKLAEAASRVEQAKQQETDLLESQRKLDAAKQGLEQLNSQYSISGDETTAQAYLLASEEYQKLLAETQKGYEEYLKNEKVYTDYEKANLNYQKAYNDYQNLNEVYETEQKKYLDDHPEIKYAGAQIQTLQQVLDDLKEEKKGLIQTGKAVDWDAVEQVNGKIETIEGMIQTKQRNSDSKLWGSGPINFIDRALSALQAGQLDWFAGMEQVDRKLGNAVVGLAADWLGGVAKIIGNRNLLKTAEGLKEKSHSESEGAKSAMLASQQAMNEALTGAGKVDGWIIQQMQSIGSMMMDSFMMGASAAYNPDVLRTQPYQTWNQAGKQTGQTKTLASSKGKEIAEQVWKQINPASGLDSLKIMAIRAGGSGMLDAQEKGYGETEQILLGVANAALEYVSEKMFGGNDIYDVDKGWMTEAVEKVIKNPKITRLMYSEGFDLLGEGLEEVFTGITEPIAEGLITGNEIEITAEDLINSFAGGVFLSLIGAGSNVIVEEVSGIRGSQRKAGKVITEANAIQELVTEGLAAEPTSEAYQLAEKLQKKLDKDRTISNREVGQLLFANQEAIDKGKLVNREEVTPDKNAPDGALNDPEDGVYAIGILTGEDGKLRYQLMQVSEDGKMRKIGEATDDLMTAKWGAQSRGANVRYIDSMGNLRENVVEQETGETQTIEHESQHMDTAEPEMERSGLEWAGNDQAERIVTEPAVPRNDSIEANKNSGIQWAGNQNTEVIENETEQPEQRRDVGESGDGQRQRGRGAERPEQSPRQRKARQAMGRAEEAGKIRRNVKAAGGSWIELKQLGVKNAAPDCIVTDVVEEAWTERVREAARVAEEVGLNFTPVLGVMEVETASGAISVDGILDTDTGEVFVRADSNRYYVDELTRHEVFHERQNQDPGLIDRVKEFVLTQYSQEQIDAMLDKYAEVYRKVYQDRVSEEKLADLIYEELFADAYAEMQRFEDADATVLTESVRKVVQEREAQQSGQKERGARYAIAETEDGKMVAVVDNDILSNIDTSTWDKSTKAEAKKAAKTALLQFRDGIVLNDVTYKVNKKSRDEYTRSNSTENLYRKNKGAFSDKMRTAENIDDVIVATTDWARDGELKHQRDDSFIDFTKGTVLLQSGENQYEAKTVVGITSEGEYVFYDITTMKPAEFKLKERFSTAVPDIAVEDAILENLSENRIADSGKSVNTKYSVTSEDVEKKALDYFGKTYRWSETGYILKNGSKLDFSGRNNGAPGGYRTVDYREIVDIYPEETDLDGNEAMIDFMSRGNIRIMPEGNGINLQTMPTKSQLQTLDDFISRVRGEVYLDIDDENGNTVVSAEYNRGTRASKVLQDIINWFEKGEKPKISELSAFYSVSSEDKAQQRAERDLAKGIGEIMQMPRSAVAELRNGMVHDLIEEYRRTGEVNTDMLQDAAATAFAQGLSINNEFYERYKDLKILLRTTAITISEQDQADIADFTQFKKRAFGTLRIVRDGGTPVDVLYQELREEVPELLPESITHPADQMVKLYEVAREIKRVETPLERALGEQSDQFYEWAEKKIQDLAENVLTKYADSVSWKQDGVKKRYKDDLNGTGQIKVNARKETDGSAALTQEELEDRDSRGGYLAPDVSNLRGGQGEFGNWREEYPEYEPQGHNGNERFEQEEIDGYRPKQTEERNAQQWLDYVMATEDGWKEYLESKRQDGEMLDDVGEMTKQDVIKKIWKELAMRSREYFERRNAAEENGNRSFGTKEKDGIADRLNKRELPPGVEPPIPEEEMDETLKEAFERMKKRREAREQEKETSEREFDPKNPLEGLTIPKRDFKATPAMDKLGIKIDGSVTSYGMTSSLRSYDKATRAAQRMVNRRIAKMNATPQEITLANLLVDGDITEEMLDQDKVNLDVVTELADHIGVMRTFDEDKLSWKRSQINDANMEIAKKLLKDCEEYEPRLKGKLGSFTKIVMNERTPERVVKQIFGDRQGEKIYETYFRPVWVNGSEMNRFENRMLERVSRFEDQNGLKRQLTEDERGMAQRLMEGEAVRVRMDELMEKDPDSHQRIEAAVQNIKNGMDWQDALNEQNLQDEELRGLAQAYSDYMDTVSVSEDMDQVILQNAIREYQTIYNELYEAINDFLVSHGYHEIGFIKGYAPHFQKVEVQNGLFGALAKLGVEKADVSALPTEIAGRTADFKPNMKWNPHMQSRKGSSTDYDIAEGFQRYLHYAAEMFYHTDDVMRVRQAVNYMRKQFAAEEITKELEEARIDSYKDVNFKRDLLRRKNLVDVTQNQTDAQINEAYQEYVNELLESATPEGMRRFSEFTSWMDNYANIVAGKQSYADRGSEYTMDRNAKNLASKVMRAFSSANVAGNLSSVLNQTAQLPLIQAELGTYLERAAISMIRGDMAKENFADRSDFLTDKKGVDKLTTDNYEKVISALFKPAEMMDRMVSTLAVRGKYLQVYDELRKQGGEGEEAIEQAMREADDFGRRVMGSRMKGAKPLGFESKGFVSQMIHVFQVEASNTMDHMFFSDLPQAVRDVTTAKGKKAAARYTAALVTKYLLGAFLINTLSDKLYGGTPAPFDLMGWVLNFVADGWGMDDDEYLKTITDNGWERLFGERLFGTEPIDTEEGIRWAGNVDDLAYNVLGDVPYIRNVLGIVGVGDQTMPTIGINDMLESLRDAGSTIWSQATEPEETGLTWAGALGRVGQDLFDVATELIPGGRQLQKTANGIEAIIRGGEYRGYGDNSSLRYPVDQNAWNAIRAGLFGLSALPETDEFYAGGKALTAAQTAKAKELAKQGVDINQTYGLYQEFAEINQRLSKERIDSAEARKLKREAIDELDLTDAQKLEVYLETMASNSETAREKYETLLSEGVTWQQLTQLDNDFSSFDADSDGDGEDDLTSLEKGIAKRNAINDMDLTDEQKLEVFDQYQLKRDSENYEKTRQEFESMLNAGLTWDEITRAHNMYAELSADKELNATQKATQYAKWADEQDWNAEQKAAIKDRYTFWQMIPAEASTYEKFTGAGLSSDSSDKVTTLLGGLEPEGGKENVTLSQKVLAINSNRELTSQEKTTAIAALAQDWQDRFVEAGVSKNTAEKLAAEIAIAKAENGEDELSYLEKAKIAVENTKTDNDTMAALSQILNESTYAKVEIASAYGVQAGDWVTFREEWLDRYGEDSISQEKVETVLDQMYLTDRERAVLWQISNKSWKPKNNPYDTGIGQLVYDELN